MGLFTRMAALLESLQKALDNLASAVRSSAARERSIFVELSHKRDPADADDRRINRGTYKAVVTYTLLTGVLLAVSIASSWVQHRDATMTLKQANAGWLAFFFRPLEFSEPDRQGTRTVSGQGAVLNRGASPVSDIHILAVVRRIEEGVPDTFEHGASVADFGLIYPDIPASADPAFHNAVNPQFPIWYLERDPKAPKNSPGKIKKISAIEFARIQSGEELLVTYARVTYLDEFKDRHEIHLCTANFPHPEDFTSRSHGSLDPKSPIQTCVHYNAMDP